MGLNALFFCFVQGMQMVKSLGFRMINRHLYQSLFQLLCPLNSIPQQSPPLNMMPLFCLAREYLPEDDLTMPSHSDNSP